MLLRNKLLIKSKVKSRRIFSVCKTSTGQLSTWQRNPDVTNVEGSHGKLFIFSQHEQTCGEHQSCNQSFSGSGIENC